MTWSGYEINVITRAAMRAPSVHAMRPWKLRLADNRVELSERPDAVLPRHDPLGRDRMISCGAALANVELALRVLGRNTRTTLFPDERMPWVVALLDSPARRPPSTVESERYSAIFRRHSYRAQFADRPVDRATRDLLVAAHGSQDDIACPAQLRPVEGAAELTSLAELLEYAGAVLRSDADYQRELSTWTGAERGLLAVPAPAADTLPWAGLVRSSTRLPGVATLSERLGRECALVLMTPDDAPVDHLRAGVALERTWLAATAAGLVGSVQTQALHVPEVRAGLIETLELAGYPQLVFRAGYPAETAPTRHTPLADRTTQKETQ